MMLDLQRKRFAGLTPKTSLFNDPKEAAKLFNTKASVTNLNISLSILHFS